MTISLRRRTVKALFWSASQSWGMKLLALVVFFVLARHLTPAEMGLAQTVLLMLAFIAIVSEQGFVDAIVQRQKLASEDLNLPFAVSMATALVASGALVLFSEEIAQALRADRAEHLILAAAVIPPIAAANMFETAMYRRQMDFRSLARASLIAGFVSGVVALTLAVQGQGAASLVAQAVVTAVVTSLVLWKTPLWKPGLKFAMPSYKGLLGYSTSAFGSRLLDFFASKIIDLIVLSRFGLVGLGTFTVGSKLYLTLLHVLAAALVDVALSAMSKISTDTERLRNAYLRFIFIASCTTAPLLMGIAALAPEVCLILFGQQWTAAADVTRWLCLLGAVQVVQFFNSSVLGATGQARQILALNALKFSLGAGVLYAANASTIGDVALYFVISQMLVAPVSFFLGMRATKTRISDLLSRMLPGMLAAVSAYAGVGIARPYVLAAEPGLWACTAVLALIYGLVVVALLAASSATELRTHFKYITNV